MERHWKEWRWVKKVTVRPDGLTIQYDGAEHGISHFDGSHFTYRNVLLTAGDEPPFSSLLNVEMLLPVPGHLAQMGFTSLRLYEVLSKRAVRGNGLSERNQSSHRLSAELTGEVRGQVQTWQYGETSPSWERIIAWMRACVFEPFLSNRASVKLPTGIMDIVMSHGSGGVLFHEALGHRLEGDAGVKLLGKPIACPLVEVYDSPLIDHGYGSYLYDDVGSLAAESRLVENGVVCGALGVPFLGRAASANARSESFKMLPISRMSNLCVQPGTDDATACIEHVRKADGLWIRRLSHGLNLGDRIELYVQEAYRAIRGKWYPVSGGALPLQLECLHRIAAVCSDPVPLPGRCVRDGQSLPVGTVCPTLMMEDVLVE